MSNAGYSTRRQNVSIGITVGAYSVDLVPAKRQGQYGNDHSLYRQRASTWTKTNVHDHINHIINSSRLEEIRVIKLWRDQKGLDLPSFYLELTVLNALSGRALGNLSANVETVLQYLSNQFPSARVGDPSNTNNIISDDLAAVGKATIKSAASMAIGSNWDQFIV